MPNFSYENFKMSEDTTVSLTELCPFKDQVTIDLKTCEKCRQFLLFLGNRSYQGIR